MASNKFRHSADRQGSQKHWMALSSYKSTKTIGKIHGENIFLLYNK